MTTRPFTFHVALTITVLVVVMGAVSWYAQPERAPAWITAMLVLPVVWGIGWLVRRQTVLLEGEDTTRRATVAISTGIIFGGLMILAGLTRSVLAGRLLPAELLSGVEQRIIMVLVGAYLVFTGNTMPKMLVPLSSVQCDGSRAQAFQRTAGWVWVLSGLVFVVSWLTLPVHIARPVSLTVVFAGILIVAALVMRLHRTRRREA